MEVKKSDVMVGLMVNHSDWRWVSVILSAGNHGGGICFSGPTRPPNQNLGSIFLLIKEKFFPKLFVNQEHGKVTWLHSAQSLN